MADGRAGKICVICGEDCSDRPRTKDPKGRYYCKPCYEKARQRARTGRTAPTPAAALYPDDRVDPTFLAEIAAQSAPPPPPPVVHVDTCPGCDQPLPPDARICVNCGVNVKSGRSLVTSRGLDETLIYGNAEQVIRLVSWVAPTGFSPIASEAMGLRKPYTAWAIALLTICISIWFWFSTDAQMNSRKDLYLAIGVETGTAHWAHLGGFAAGAVIALALLFGRLLNAGGGDLVSVILGRHAWKLIGRPGDSERLGLRLPGI